MKRHHVRLISWGPFFFLLMSISSLRLMERAERACCILARPGSEIYSIYPRPCGCQLFDTSLMTAHGKVQSRTRTQNPVPAAIIKRYEIIKRYGEISSDEEGVMVMSAGISSRSEVTFLRPGWKTDHDSVTLRGGERLFCLLSWWEGSFTANQSWRSPSSYDETFLSR